MSGRPGSRRAVGFTLVEVLVALAVFAVGMTALIVAGAQRAQDLSYLRDRTLASWIAADRIDELRLERHWRTGRRDGEVEMAGQTWIWEAEVVGTANEAVHRVEVAVSRGAGAEPVTRLTGFLGDPEHIADAEPQGDRPGLP
ncbi:MAG: type II secretion system minor pseudopilin GspI [Halofilum sp. (in: g-proteobacteria)]